MDVLWNALTAGLIAALIVVYLGWVLQRADSDDD